jgi:hypothetical protein
MEQKKKGIVIERYTIYNIARIAVKNFPVIVSQYAHTFIVEREAYERLRAFLLARKDFAGAPDVYRLGESVIDWGSTQVTADSPVCYISVSEKVFNDADFKVLMMELFV